MKKVISFFILGLLINNNLYADIRLPNIIGSHMVIQQNTTVKIWGWGAPEEKVIIKTGWDTVTYQTITQNSAKWSVEIKTPKSGGPYQISIAGNNTLLLDDIMVGEVWVCSGQSNMEWSGDQKLQEAIDEAPNANNKNIRFFYVPKSTSPYPQENMDARWMVCTPEEMIHFSAIGYFYGKNLAAALQSPVGLINANWGGTPAETWTPEYVVKQSDRLSQAASKINETPWWSNKVGDTYNAMIAPLTSFTIAGVIWYQGESNTETYYGYHELFTKMIDAWRAEWKKNFPFYFVQIAPFNYGIKNIGALLRDEQTKAAKHPNTAMVVVSDLVPDTNNIHPILKKEVAKRLSDIALNQQYGMMNTVCLSPNYTKHEIIKDKIKIYFDHAASGLMIKGDKATCFEIAGEDQLFFPASVKIEENTVLVYHKNIKNPKAVRFAFNNTALPNLFNKEGLPVNLFRTDEWNIKTNKL